MANENMIQKHVDNFLAKIAGETPIDDNPHNSTEFWLNEIAENLPGGGGTLYVHSVFSQWGTNPWFYTTIITNDATPFTRDSFLAYIHNIHTDSTKPLMINGATTTSTPTTSDGCIMAIWAASDAAKVAYGGFSQSTGFISGAFAPPTQGFNDFVRTVSL